MSEHGTRSRYVNQKCRCEACLLANRAYNREYGRKRTRLARIGREAVKAVKREGL